MKRFPLLVLLVVSVAAVMLVSFEVLRRSRSARVSEFDGAQRRMARETATALAARLSAFDRDGTLLANLVEQTRGAGDGNRAWQDREILAACGALATTVSHYRTIGVFSAAGVEPIVAVDPTEDRTHTVPLLIDASLPMAFEVTKTRRPAWRGPVRLHPSRSFYLYATPAGASEAVVVTIDVALLLQDVLRFAASGSRFIVADAASVLWVDCEATATCHRGELEPPVPRPVPASRGARGRGMTIGGDAPPSDSIDTLTPAAAAVQELGSGADTMLATTQSVTTPLGVWSLILRSSTSAIDARQRALLWQLVLTSAGVIAAMLSVGVFIVRQQRTAAALEGELKAARQLADLRERSDKILENVSVGILGATRSGRVVFANGFFQRRGLPLRGHEPALEPARALAEWTERLRPHIERALEIGRTGLISNDESVPRIASDPSFDVRVVPLSHPVEDVEALVLVEDLSELHQLRRQLIRAEKLVTVGALSAGIAHEIGTPLMVIRGHAEHLLEKLGATSAAHGLEAIVAQIDRIAGTIRRVLDFSRAQPTQVSPTELPQVIARAAELLEWRLRTRHISLCTRPGADPPPPLAADALQLEQVLVNLLMNACDASFDGGTIEIVLAAAPPRDRGAPPRVRFDVVDHGAGIPPEHINAVFDPYFTTKKTGEGTGLGLTIVSQIVHNHRGELSIHATAGGGTTMSVTWPSAQEST